MRSFCQKRLFTLEKRSSIYYVKYKNPKTGKRLSAISTRKNNIQEAELQAYKWLSEGIPNTRTNKKKDINELFDIDTFLYHLKHIDFQRDDIDRVLKTLQNRHYISSYKLKENSTHLIKYLLESWNYETSEIIREKKAFNHRTSRVRCIKMTSDINNHWKDYFKDKDLEDLTKKELKKFIIHLSEKNLASRTINSIFSAGSVPIKAAYENGIIKEEITKGIIKISGKTKKRGILEDPEVMRLFSLGKWVDDRYRTVNLLSATCGLRMGEIRALQIQDIEGDRLHIRHSWCHVESKVKSTRTGENRYVPLIPEVKEELSKLIDLNPFGKDPDNFIFFSWSDREKPLYDNLILKALKAALYSIGISEEERKMRNISFHSWRHYHVKKMADVLNERAMLISGHKNREVFEICADHQQEQDFKAAADASSEVFGKILQFENEKIHNLKKTVESR